MHRWWDGRAETHRALTDLSKQKVLRWGGSRLPPLPAWPEACWHPYLPHGYGQSFRRKLWCFLLKRERHEAFAVLIPSPSTLYLTQQNVEHKVKVSPCPVCSWSRWVQFPNVFPATVGFYSAALSFLKI